MILFIAALAFHAWGVSVGWKSRNLPGVEFRQAQTALSTYHINQDDRFDLAYPTPVLGKPWSVPMEFPLYQWTVVVTSRITGLGLTKAARAVSIACFYLALPAIFLLLARWAVPPGRRWLVLALVVSCPFYIFYSRAFLIETMALMFALWFWVAMERAVAGRRLGWLALAIVAGCGAGLVKVTTLMIYLIPVLLWCGLRLWQGRRDLGWRGDLRWMVAALAPAALSAGWWVVYADRIKAANPMADFLSSENLRDFNLGTVASRFSGELWAQKLQIVTWQLTWLPVLLGAVLLPLLGGRQLRMGALACLLVFAGALVLFPVLYAYHEYYFVANAVLLLLAAGLGVVGLMETARGRVIGLIVALVLCAGQAYRYVAHFYPDQRGISPGGNSLSQLLQAMTRPKEVIIIAGQDWNSMTPYYARRRALMLREEATRDMPRIDAALHELADERIGALVITGRPWRELFPLVSRLAPLGLSPEPWLAWGDTWVFLPQDRWLETVLWLEGAPPPGVGLVPGTRLPAAMTGSWREYSALGVEQQQLFASMQPAPRRFLCTFEPQVRGSGKDAAFSLHPWTRLVFPLPAGAHTLRMVLWFDPSSYQVAAGEDPTDGVGITALSRRPGETPQVLRRWHLDPAAQPADRGAQPVVLEFTLDHAGDLELIVDPGQHGRDTRDWIWIQNGLSIN
ncbi:MAG: hypothetical protein KF897_07865 [Opitutaceae bacterium]|nr:hypothetical protein [Opitutaceae bacterium]